jgi:hypothetical protein
MPPAGIWATKFCRWAAKNAAVGAGAGDAANAAADAVRTNNAQTETCPAVLEVRIAGESSKLGRKGGPAVPAATGTAAC